MLNAQAVSCSSTMMEAAGIYSTHASQAATVGHRDGTGRIRCCPGTPRKTEPETGRIGGLRAARSTPRAGLGRDLQGGPGQAGKVARPGSGY
jgi:hypothetical protein